ncbi:MAG: CD3072 family TudS-related putative desulfidase [Eubacteriales bacterium]
MERKKDIVLTCHCLLNRHSKVDGSSKGDGLEESIISYLIDKKLGIIQLPCPETTFAGIRRWGQVKEQYDTPYFRKHCKELFMPFLDQIVDYHNNGYTIRAIIGIDGSPSCGVHKTCSSRVWGGEIGNGNEIESKIKDLKMVEGKGIFIEEIEKCLLENQIKMKFIALDEENPELGIFAINEIFI